jgi:hypothetical protein
LAKTTLVRREGTILSTDKVKLDTPVQEVNHDLVKTTGVALPDAAGIEGEPDTPRVKKALEDEKFMAEMIEIQVHEPGDSENEHRYCEVTVNGDYRCIPRDGQVHRVKRYHVAVIASAKVQRLRQEKVTAADGSMGYKETAVMQPLYPFSVIHDPNPAGVTWVRQLMQRS